MHVNERRGVRIFPVGNLKKEYMPPAIQEEELHSQAAVGRTYIVRKHRSKNQKRPFYSGFDTSTRTTRRSARHGQTHTDMIPGIPGTGLTSSRYEMVRNEGMECKRTGQDGMGCIGGGRMGSDVVGPDGTGWDGMGWNRMAYDDSADGMAYHGMVWNGSHHLRAAATASSTSSACAFGHAHMISSVAGLTLSNVAPPLRGWMVTARHVMKQKKNVKSQVTAKVKPRNGKPCHVTAPRQDMKRHIKT